MKAFCTPSIQTKVQSLWPKVGSLMIVCESCQCICIISNVFDDFFFQFARLARKTDPLNAPFSHAMRYTSTSSFVGVTSKTFTYVKVRRHKISPKILPSSRYIMVFCCLSASFILFHCLCHCLSFLVSFKMRPRISIIRRSVGPSRFREK